MRLSKRDWLKRGLGLLTRFGPDELKIDRLCRHLKVTKGSFYHHFDDRRSYVGALLDFWQQQSTQAVIDAVDNIADLNQRRLTLSQITQQADTGPENAIRSWARYEPLVAHRLQMVDQERIDYLAKMLAPQIPDPAQAPLVAKLVYAHFVGTQQLGELVSAQEWKAMDNLLRILLTSGNDG